jgi:hypothetical protein
MASLKKHKTSNYHGRSEIMVMQRNHSVTSYGFCWLWNNNPFSTFWIQQDTLDIQWYIHIYKTKHDNIMNTKQSTETYIKQFLKYYNRLHNRVLHHPLQPIIPTQHRTEQEYHSRKSSRNGCQIILINYRKGSFPRNHCKATAKSVP